MDDICFMPATQIAAEIQTGNLSPIEVVDATLKRLERVNQALNAFALVLHDEARKAAYLATEEIAAHEARGLLHGVPILLKDMTPVAGVRTSYGSKAFAHFVPEKSAPHVERLLDAGGILLGKTTTPEYGHKAITESPLTGRTNNPWNVDYTAGGSSGGSAAAIAAGLGYLADGGDGAGSIRVPASCCGVVGYKPSFGRIPTSGISSFSGLLHRGPITRTVKDAALMLTVLAGRDDRDPYSLDETGTDYLAALEGATVHGIRVAYSRDLGLAPVEPEVISCTDAAARIFAEQLGAIVEEATPKVPNPEGAMMKIWETDQAAGVVDALLPRVAVDQIDPTLLLMFEHAENLTAIDFWRAFNTFRGKFYQGMMRFFETFELLITPTIACAPFQHPTGLPGPSHVRGVPVNPLFGWLLTYPFNLTGQPAISVPCGFSKEGLPIGLQIVGRRHADISVLRAAAAYEQAAPWQHLRPPIEAN